jgi:regulation of enolase protein 1 (concanavalin A-like superfamily)
MSSSRSARLRTSMLVLLAFAVVITPTTPGLVVASGPPEWVEMQQGEYRPGEGEQPVSRSQGSSGPPSWVEMDAGDRAGETGPPKLRTGPPSWSQAERGDSERPDSDPPGPDELAPWAEETPVADEESPSWPGRGREHIDGIPPGRGLPDWLRDRLPDSVPVPWLNEQQVGRSDTPGNNNRGRANRTSRLNSGSGSLTFASATDAEEPVIDVWYGDEQSFGMNGTPQRWFNILGNVSPPGGISSLSYILNDGESRELSIGPNGNRLVSAGDFNIEIDRWDLQDGTNNVRITAIDGDGASTVKDVTVNYSAGNIWPSPYEIDWSGVNQINDVAQVIDGLWSVSADGVRPVEIGYDRLIGIGDVTWDDFEIEVPVTIHGFGSTYPPAVGLGARWAGHYPHDDSGEHPQPRWEWRPLGALGWYEWSNSLNCFRLNIHGDTDPLVEDDTCSQLEVGTRYIFKFRVETINPDHSQYELKVWKDGEEEPAEWDLSAVKSGHLHRGSALLVAQDIDATFGDVKITPLSEPTDPDGPPNGLPPASPITSDDFNSGTELKDIWTFVDPVGDASLKLDGLQAKVTVPAGTSHDLWTSGLDAAQLLQTVPNTDFDIGTKFVSQPQGTHAMQGLIAKADNFNYVRFDFYSSGSDLNVFAATFSNGSPTVRANASIPNAEEMYLRMQRQGSQWTLLYRLDGEDWNTLATFGYSVGISQVGICAGNAGSNPPGFTAAVDYFFNMNEPIDPYNVNPLPPPEPSIIQSDDFNYGGTELNDFWTFIDPVGQASLDLDGMTSSISLPAGFDHDIWINGNNAPRLMQSSNDTDFDLVTRFVSQPSGHHGMQGMVVEADEQNFIRFDYYSTGNDLNLFAANFSNGSPTVRANIGLEPGSPLYLRIQRERDSWKLLYSDDNEEWTVAAEFTFMLDVSAVGFYGANAAPGLPAVTAEVDYFFNMADPIDPVNAIPPPPPAPSTLQSDDFNSGEGLNDFWTFVDPVGDSDLSFDGINARIKVPGGVDHDMWLTGANAPRLMQAANDTDFGIEARFSTRPTGTHSAQGLVVMDDAENFVRFDFYSSDGHLNLFAGSVIGGGASAYVNQSVASGNLLTLRLTRTGNDWLLEYSTDGTNWETAASISLNMKVAKAGVFVANAGPGFPEYTGGIDYFFNTAEPIDPINVNPPPPPPSSTLQSDDFTSETMGSHWSLVDPLGNAELRVDGNALLLGVPQGVSHDFWVTNNNAPRVIQQTNDTDFEYVANFESRPAGTHAMQGMVVQTAEGVDVRFDFYSAGETLNMFAGTLTSQGAATAHANQPFDATGPMYLRIRRVGDEWTLSASDDAETWNEIAKFSLAVTVTHAGFFVGNADPDSPAFTGVIDSFVSNPVH